MDAARQVGRNSGQAQLRVVRDGAQADEIIISYAIFHISYFIWHMKYGSAFYE